MQADYKCRQSYGAVTKKDIPLDEPKKIMDFLEVALKKLIHKCEKDDSEDDLTQKLVLISIAMDSIWGFVQQHKSKKNIFKEDIGVAPKSDDTNIFFVIEAKRLNTNLKKYREKEYVVGRYSNDKYEDSGGIERYKKEKHGKEFVFAGMIGYVQTDEFDIWENRVNTWIESEITSPSSSELIWCTKDKLISQKKSPIISRYSSIHDCLSRKEIYLEHVWVKL